LSLSSSSPSLSESCPARKRARDDDDQTSSKKYDKREEGKDEGKEELKQLVCQIPLSLISRMLKECGGGILSRHLARGDVTKFLKILSTADTFLCSTIVPILSSEEEQEKEVRNWHATWLSKKRRCPNIDNAALDDNKTTTNIEATAASA
jgi:hypothetical protein